MTVKQIRIERLRTRREHPGREVLPHDARDPDVVRAKALARSRLTGYLYMIATNLIRDHWRKTEREDRAVRSTALGERDA
jgi:hypothetical protein